jgi:thioredoxin 1
MDRVGTLVLGVLAVLLLIQVYPLLRARQVRGRAVPGLEAVLTDRQRAQARLLVYFWSPRCGVCATMTSIIDKLASERGAVVKVNIAESTVVAREFGAMATPSLAVVEQALVQRLLGGAQNEPRIRALLVV